MANVRHYDLLQNDKYGRYLVANKDLINGEIIFTDTPFAFGPKPGKLLLAKENDPDRWQHELEAMETHTEARQKRQTWAADQVNIADFLVDHCKLGTRFDKELVQRVCGILEVRIRAIYPRLAIAAHSCVPNIVHTILTNDYQLPELLMIFLRVQVRAAVPIKSGETLHLCYTHVLSPTIIRREFLIQSKFFNCDCPRCADPTELGTHLSTLKCNKCDNGVILSTNPLAYALSILDSPSQRTAASPTSFTLSSQMITIRAAVPIKSGETLHLCYTHVLSPTIIRREFLIQSKFFNCDCPRCADPTELGTHLSTLKCNKCDNGVILSTNPLDNDAQWKCTDKNCEFRTSGAAMRKMLAVAQADLEQLDAIEPGPQAIELREATIQKYKSVFHPRHSLLLSIKHSLAQLYGRVEGYNIGELPDLTLERKAEFCRLLLKTLDVISPGDSRMRGMMVYELHAPLMFLARSQCARGLIALDSLKARLQEPIRCLAEAARILTREDPHSPEGITGLIASRY
ncbi:Protein msta, isoform A [Operophtera brumata]|uniref:Protein msta, isoform A n=1 Tax=Operophtera brumata TaxID=104452 RepID=A0A0L7LKT7_OPEBR|nr:Protein msta, isoform A [Operophtera brumata]